MQSAPLLPRCLALKPQRLMTESKHHLICFNVPNSHFSGRIKIQYVRLCRLCLQDNVISLP